MRRKEIGILVIILATFMIISGCREKQKSYEDIGFGNMKISDKDSEVYEYLQEHNKVIDAEELDNFEDLSIMDTDLEGKEIFFTGEYHGTKGNGILKMKFIKYFKEKTNFKYYLCEDSYSGAYFLNKYLESGDEEILEEIYKPLRGTFASNKGGYNHWKEIYEYNERLPENDRIKVIGADIEHQIENSYRFFMDVLPKTDVPDEIGEIIDELKSNWTKLILGKNENLSLFSERLKKDISEKEDIYIDYLGDNFFAFNHVNNNIINRDTAYGQRDEDWNNVRDKMIYDNFASIYDEIPKGKFYGQWGLNHAFQSKEGDTMWFATYLNEEGSIFQNKILTIAYFYDNCEFMKQSGNGANTMSTLGKDSGMKIFNDPLNEDFTLYKLNGEELPLEILYDSNNLDIPITDFFQYMVVMKDSKAEEPLNK